MTNKTDSTTTEFEQLEKDNDKIRVRILKNLSKYMMSDEVDDTQTLINDLINNEIEQEGFCGEWK